MLKEVLMLASYSGFSGGDFGNLLAQWEQMGVFSYMLPFLLIFALIYGVLSKLNLFGAEANRGINAIIALATALMALQFGAVSVFFSDIFPRLGVAMAVVLIFLILIGLFGKNKSLSTTLMWGAFGTGVVIVLQSTAVFGYGGPEIFDKIPSHYIPWIAFIILIAIVLIGARKPSTDEPTGGIFVKSMAGE